MIAWNGWYHVQIGTYGTWLPGDPRGWRSRHHRVHCEGDYRNPPPPGQHEPLLRRSEELMEGPAVFLNDAQKRTGGQALVEMLVDLQVELLTLSLDAVHGHLLARFGSLPIRRTVGKAKQHAYHVSNAGRIWAKRCNTVPIESRSHQVSAYRYILAHAKKGAWVWSYKEGLYWRE